MLLFLSQDNGTPVHCRGLGEMLKKLAWWPLPPPSDFVPSDWFHWGCGVDKMMVPTLVHSLGHSHLQGVGDVSFPPLTLPNDHCTCIQEVVSWSQGCWQWRLITFWFPHHLCYFALPFYGPVAPGEWDTGLSMSPLVVQWMMFDTSWSNCSHQLHLLTGGCGPTLHPFGSHHTVSLWNSISLLVFVGLLVSLHKRHRIGC